jgi:hypothetical protein
MYKIEIIEWDGMSTFKLTTIEEVKEFLGDYDFDNNRDFIIVNGITVANPKDGVNWEKVEELK